MQNPKEFNLEDAKNILLFLSMTIEEREMMFSKIFDEYKE